MIYNCVGMWCWLVLKCFLTFSIAIASGDKTLGAIFDDGGFNLEAAFNVALAAVTEDQENPFVANVIKTPPGDITETEKAMCSMLESNIFAVFGPTENSPLQHVQSIADFLEIPHILATPVVNQNRNWSAVNLYPHHIAYSQVFTDIIKAKGWTEFTVIYEGAEFLPVLENIFNVQDILDSERNLLINVVQLPDGGDFRTQLQTIKSSGSVNYLVTCRFESVELFLTQAQQVGIMSNDHSYLIMNPDFQTIDIAPFKHGGSNITGIRFFDPGLESIQNFITSLNEKVKELSEGGIENAISENGLTLELALVYDAVTLYASALNAMGLEDGANVTCGQDESWNFGSTVVNYVRANPSGKYHIYETRVLFIAFQDFELFKLKILDDDDLLFQAWRLPSGEQLMEIDGLTGPIKFDSDGFRSDFEVEVIEVVAYGFEKVAEWSAEDGYIEKRTIIPPVEVEGVQTMKGKHFLVITALSAPYGMLKESSKKLEGNDRYEGFGIEIIDELAKMNEFNYTFEIQEDGVYGSLDADTGEWNGMMEKIMHGKADFAITDLTITSARQKAVDFTSPFMNLGITILYKKPTKEPPNPFSFISPFSSGVWILVAGTYVGASVLFFVLGRIAPEEWQNPYPCIEEPETLDNQWSLANSFWYTLGSLLTQGSELAPIAVSTRMAGSMWMFFVLIMASSYTANLAAFLTVESKFYAIKNIYDLSLNPYDIQYGAKNNGATFTFFKESDNLLYQKIYKYMEENPKLMTATNDIGLARVQSTTENYAFLMESTSIEYMVERHCDVAQVGGLLDSKGYGIAMIKNSPYRQPMSESILQLQEEGTLTRMKNKWWKEKRGGGMCADDDGEGSDAQPLVLANVGGVFIVLIIGCALAILCAILEMVFDVWMISRRMKVPFKEELIAELKFVFSFSGDTKTVRHRESTSSGSGSSKKEEDAEKKDDDQETVKEEVEDRAPTPSQRSTHSRHTLHSRRQSNATHMARMRKYSARI